VQTSEVKIGGFGGQGVILMGIIIGKAASIFDDGHATLTQAFGPEARGSACSAQLVLDKVPILYPYIHNPDVMILMSQEAYTKFSPELKEGGILVIEEDLVHPDSPPPPPGAKVFSIPSTRMAEQLGRKLIQNIVMVGFITAVSGLVSEDSAREAVKSSVPRGTEDLNLKAFEAGLAHGKKQLEPAL
jgi:2-oxoglutarate ferredoxin oxidoreductase subunit gamma